MNSYKFTFHYPEGSDETAFITERTEPTARKALLKRFGKDIEITDSELHDTDVNATKEQEREALEKIKAMVAELGPQSYLKTAFEGVFEDAEQNIEDDAAYSMKARLEIQAQRAIERGYEVDQLKADLAAARSDVEVLRSQLDHAQGQIDTLKRQQFPEELRRDLWVMVTTEAEASRARMAEAAEKMSVGADNPACVLFKDSVALYRAEKARAEAMEQRAAELDALEPKTEK
ncbi:hypothetical protein [Alistipes sp.]|uniref:hypothetical protein n=1 Tax=Alistipes sp. TaxID=1872444 RepID=UPI0031FD2732